jgi:hypothetical protein
VSAIPTYPWRAAPEGLATRRQLAANGLRPGGSPVVAQLERPRRRGRPPLQAYLYEVAAAVPKREPTEGNRRAVAAMIAARSTCRCCGIQFEYCLPAGRICLACNDCEDPMSNLELPPGIADAELWRQRVRAILAAAGDEGLVVPELIDAIEANHDERFDRRRVLHWLRAEQNAGVVDEDGEGMWQVRTADGASVIEDFLRSLADSGTPGLPDSVNFVLGEAEDADWFTAPTCRVCGCGEDTPCAGGCAWVPDPWQDGDLCSACLPPDPGLHTQAGRPDAPTGGEQ